MVSLFCRHNRFTADCLICSRGTVLDTPGSDSRRSARPAGRGGTAEHEQGSRPGARESRGGTAKRAPGGAAVYRGPYASAGPYERAGEAYEVRLERVPGGLRLAEWAAESLRPSAPVLAVDDLAGLIDRAAAARALDSTEHEALAAALAATSDPSPVLVPSAVPDPWPSRHGASSGRSGELREELRVERIEERRLRVARWVLRPGTGWDLLDAPTMLAAQRYAEALADAARQGLLAA